MIDVNELTIGQVKEIAAITGCGGGGGGRTHSIKVGKAYFIRTVTNYFTGKVDAITDSDIVLSDAAWIADTGRFHTALKTGKLNEVEPYPDGCIVARGAIIDMARWPHVLPGDQK